MMHLKHRNIVEMCDFYTSNNQLCIVMSYADGGDLRNEVIKARNGKTTISEEIISVWMIQVWACSLVASPPPCKVLTCFCNTAPPRAGMPSARLCPRGANHTSRHQAVEHIPHGRRENSQGRRFRYLQGARRCIWEQRADRSGNGRRPCGHETIHGAGNPEPKGLFQQGRHLVTRLRSLRTLDSEPPDV